MDMCLLVVELDDLIAVLLQAVQMFDLILVAFYRLSVRLLDVDALHSKQLLLVIEHLVDLEQRKQRSLIRAANSMKMISAT